MSGCGAGAATLDKGDRGIEAEGAVFRGHSCDAAYGAEAFLGGGGYGVQGHGPTAAGDFPDQTYISTCLDAAYGPTAVSARGFSAGGRFRSTSGGEAYAGWCQTGLAGYSSQSGG